MKTKILLLIIIILTQINSQAQQINLLFLGNSFTANTQLNQTVKALINAGTSGKTVNLSDAVILYGQNLDAHWKNPASLSAIRSGNYTYVIIQGYINTGVGDVGIAQMRDTAFKYGKLIANESRLNNEIPLVFCHQANCNATQANWDTIYADYRRLALISSSVFVPASLSWIQAKAMIAGLSTHDPDCHHQNDIGNYLSACVFYYKITGQSPVGNPYRTSNNTIIGADTALILQQAAAVVVESENGTPVADVSLSPANIDSLAANTTTQLTANISPANATNKSVTWKTSDPFVASVNSTGLVSGVTAGTATITVTTVDGVKTATCTITVKGKSNDTIAPSIPTNLSASSFTSSSFILSWKASTDNVGILLYEIFADGDSIGITSGTNTSFKVTGLNASANYAITIKAIDPAGNISIASASLNITTLSASTIFSDGDFITLGPLGGVFTAGMNNQQVFHTQKGNAYATKITSNGNPGNAIVLGSYGSQVLLSLDAPSITQTWTIEFDQMVTGSVYGGPSLRVFGLTNGQTIAYGGATSGTTLFTQNSTGTEATWTHKSYTVNVPSGMHSVVFDWLADAVGVTIDNVTVKALPTSLETIETKIKIFPNPVLNILNISNIESGSVISIYDLKGTLQLQKNTLSNNQQIDVSSLINGVYILKINNKRGIVVEKFIKE